MRTPPSSAAARTAGPLAAPLNLIHTNNSPKPVSMRVSGGSSLENWSRSELDSLLDFLASPVGSLLLKRRGHAAN